MEEETLGIIKISVGLIISIIGIFLFFTGNWWGFLLIFLGWGVELTGGTVRSYNTGPGWILIMSFIFTMILFAFIGVWIGLVLNSIGFGLKSIWITLLVLEEISLTLCCLAGVETRP